MDAIISFHEAIQDAGLEAIDRFLLQRGESHERAT